MANELLTRGHWISLFAVFFIVSAINAHPLVGQFPSRASGKNGAEPVTFNASFATFAGGRTGLLSIETTLAPHLHIYSLTQPPGGPMPTQVKVPAVPQFRLLDSFKEDRAPEVLDPDPVFGTRVEQHSLAVTFFVPIELAEGVDPQQLTIDLTINGQQCNDQGCLPFKNPLKAKYAGNIAVPTGLDIEALVAKAGPWPRDASGPPAEATKTAVPAAGEGVRDKEEAPPKIEKAPAEEFAKLYDPNSKIHYVTLRETTATYSFWPAVFGMLIGGLLLNLMPCVFPVLGLKVLGFVELGGSDPRRVALHGLAFTLGVIVSMWVLAGVILGIKFALGNEVNWGQQMGNPYFVGGIIILMFVLGLNLAGVFEMGMFMTRLGSSGRKQTGYAGSFFAGVLTTFVATPCSGPFLGAAMSYTLSQEPAVAFTLFTVFAIGIALPYLALSLFPNMIRALPRPGAWMETFKQLMSFALFATAAFFFRSFAKQTGTEGAWWLTMALCVIALGFYCYGHWSLGHVPGLKRFLWGIVTPILLCAAGIWMYWDAARFTNEHRSVERIGGLPWDAWVPGIVEHRLAQGKMVWVDYTADWCLTCKLNEKRIFSNSAVIDKVKQLGVQMVLVDMTAQEQEKTDDLSRADRKIIPVNLIYPSDYPNRPAILLEEMIGPEQILEALERAK